MTKKIILIILLGLTMLLNAETSKNILIISGSMHGSTAEVAGKMEIYLESGRCSVDRMAAPTNRIDISKYDLVVIGSGIYGGQPHPSIKIFIEKNRLSLSQKKIAVFAICGTMSSPDGKKRESALIYPDRVANGLATKSKAVFAGRLADGGKFGNFMLKLLWGSKPGDYRDWDKIKFWTLSLRDL